MALAQLYTAVPNDTITAARWNNEFGNIYNNGTTVAFPLTTAVSFAGFTVALDASGVTTISSTASQGINYTPGAKAGAPNTGAGKTINFVSQTFTDSSTAGSGTATSCAFTTFQQPQLAATNSSVTTTNPMTVFIADGPAAGTNQTLTNRWALYVADGSVYTGSMLAGTLAYGGHINGLTYANNVADATNDIDIAIGEATDGGTDATIRRLMILGTALTKRSDATWVVGTNQGMLDTGAVGDNDYYLFLIMRTNVNPLVVDVLCSLSSAAPTMPASYTHKRLIGWFKRTGGAIVAFHTYQLEGGGLHFLWDTPTLDVDLAATLTTSEREDAAKVPLLFSTLAQLNVSAEDAAATSVIYMYCPDLEDTTPSATAAPLATTKAQVANVENIAQVEVRTNAAGLIAAEANVATYDDYSFATVGFKWSRR